MQINIIRVIGYPWLAGRTGPIGLSKGALTAVLEPGLNVPERHLELLADVLDRGDDGDGNEPGDERVLDGGCSGPASCKACQRLHDCSPGRAWRLPRADNRTVLDAFIDHPCRTAAVKGRLSRKQEQM